jgi:hypothetical protein
MKKLTFENETHWRTKDVQRIVRLAMDAGGADVSEARVVRILYPKKASKVSKKKTRRTRRKSTGEPTNPSVASIRFCAKAMTTGGLTVSDGDRRGEVVETEIVIHLPRQGAKKDHPVAMVALAANRAVAGIVEEDAALLPFSDVYFMANYLAYHFAYEALLLYDDENGALKKKTTDLREFYREISCPEWVDASKLYIAKYKDPLKDATFQSFVKKKEAAIKREQTVVDRLTDEIASAQRKRRAAEKRKKAAEKSLKDATARRS